MLVRLVSNSQLEVICLPLPPKVLGLQTCATEPGRNFLYLELHICYLINTHNRPIKQLSLYTIMQEQWGLDKLNNSPKS